VSWRGVVSAVDMYALAKYSPFESKSCRIPDPANLMPGAQAAFCRRFPSRAALALESSLVQPDYPGWGSIRNLLVYLPPARRVNKTQRYYLL